MLNCLESIFFSDHFAKTISLWPRKKLLPFKHFVPGFAPYYPIVFISKYLKADIPVCRWSRDISMSIV